MIIIVDTEYGPEVLKYPNRLVAVRSLMENARIAPKPEYFGAPSHEVAIGNIRDHCDTVMKAIEKDRAEDAEAAKEALSESIARPTYDESVNAALGG